MKHKLCDGLEIRIINGNYELWQYFNSIVYYKLLDLSKETAEGLIKDATKTISITTRK